MQSADSVVHLEDAVYGKHLFSKDECEKLSHANEYNVISEFRMYDDCGQMKLEHKYKTDNQEEEAACDYLDVHKGCILSDVDKPFDCKIWPLRIMKRMINWL